MSRYKYGVLSIDLEQQILRYGTKDYRAATLKDLLAITGIIILFGLF